MQKQSPAIVCYISEVSQQWHVACFLENFTRSSCRDPFNYRPTGLTSVCCKTLEHIVAFALVEYLEHSLLLSEQFGFRRRKCLEDQLLLTYGGMAELVNGESVLNMVLLDFSKAFDNASHEVPTYYRVKAAGCV